MKESRKIWITADVLARRLRDAAKGGIVELAHNEFLTPNAVDLADQRHVAVRRLPGAQIPKAAGSACGTAALGCDSAAPPADGGAGSRDRPGGGAIHTRGGCATFKAHDSASKSQVRFAGTGVVRGSIGLVLDRPTERTRGLVDSLYREGHPLADYTMADCWICNARAMCAAVAAGQLAGGLIVRPYAAAAMVLANKIRGIRAVQGASRAAVRAACAEFKANVLIVEQATSTFHEVRTMVQTFAAGLAAMGQTNPLLDAVAELERG